MRQSPIGPDGPRRDGVPPRTSSRRSGGRWLPRLAFLAALAAPASLLAQEDKAPAPGGSIGANPAGATPLARYFPRENLLFYFEFSGVDAHPDAWNKTAAYRMLTETPLGEMFEEVGTQLVDKALSYAPGHKLNGQEIITLIKFGLKHGMAFGFVARPTSSDKTFDFTSLTIVIRDGASKEIRGLTSRLMGTTMTNTRPRLEKREGRTLVVLPVANPAPVASEVKYEGNAWWAEKDDLVLCLPYPSTADQIFAALDGKIPSAVDHPAVQELSRKEGTFEPDCIAFLDLAGCPKAGKQSEPLEKLVEKYGIQRFGFRWGFDDDALMQEFRITAPKPRKPELALLDQPGFDAKSLMPTPPGVDTFVQLSIDPNGLIDTVAQLAPAGTVKAKVDEFSEAIRSSGKIDFRKDFLGRLGPRMVLFLAPDKSAAVGGSFQTDWLKGLSPQAGVPTTLISQNKLTLLAEVSEPKAFGRTLEGAINALNRVMEKQTADLLEQAESDQSQPGAGGGQAGANARRPGGQRGTRKRSASQMSPHFVAMVNTTAAVAVGSSSSSLDKQSYILRTPSDSPLKIVPDKVHPVIKFDGKYLVISVAADSADAALKVAKQKDWQPSDDVRKAGEHLPNKMVLLAVSDPREIMPAILANFPGTLQIIINTGIAAARAQAAAGQQGGPGGPGAAPGAPGGPGAAPGGPGMMGMRGRGGPGMMGRGGGMGMGRGGRGPAPGAEGGAAPGAEAGGDGGLNIPADAMVELKVDAEKLPKADDLRSRYFLSTVTITVTDQDIRLASRQAFVTLYDLIGVAGFTAGFVPAFQKGREAARKAQEEANQQAAGGQAPAAGPGPGQQGPGGPGMRGGRGGGRGPMRRGPGGG